MNEPIKELERPIRKCIFCGKTEKEVHIFPYAYARFCNSLLYRCRINHNNIPADVPMIDMMTGVKVFLYDPSS